MTWGQPCPVAGTLVGLAEDRSLCGHFPDSGAQASGSPHGQVGGQGGQGCRDGSSSPHALPAPSVPHGLSTLRITQLQLLTGDSTTRTRQGHPTMS